MFWNRITSLSKLCCIICVCVYIHTYYVEDFLQRLFAFFVKGSWKCKCNCYPTPEGMPNIQNRKYGRRWEDERLCTKGKGRVHTNGLYNTCTYNYTQHICLHSCPISWQLNFDESQWHIHYHLPINLHTRRKWQNIKDNLFSMIANYWLHSPMRYALSLQWYFTDWLHMSTQHLPPTFSVSCKSANNNYKYRRTSICKIFKTHIVDRINSKFFLALWSSKQTQK